MPAASAFHALHRTVRSVAVYVFWDLAHGLRCGLTTSGARVSTMIMVMWAGPAPYYLHPSRTQCVQLFPMLQTDFLILMMILL